MGLLGEVLAIPGAGLAHGNRAGRVIGLGVKPETGLEGAQQEAEMRLEGAQRGAKTGLESTLN